MAEVVLYKRDSCPFCRKVMGFLDAKGIDVPMRDTDTDADARETLVRVGGKNQVPCLFIDGKPMYESDDIIEWFEANPL